MFSALLLGTLVTASSGGGEGGQWTAVSSLNVARQEVGAARIGDDVYVVGGLVAGLFQATPTVERYDMELDTWSLVAPLPEKRDHMGVAAVDGRLFCIGGFHGFFVPRFESWVYDPDLDTWDPIAPLPEPLGACWSVAHGGKLYVFGGVDQTDTIVPRGYAYDPRADEWSPIAPMPTAREHLAAVSVGEYVYVFGGRNHEHLVGGQPQSVAVNERYHPATDTWTTMAPMPTARSASAVAELGGKIYVMGGEIPGLYANNEVYDVATDSWTRQADMVIPRHGIAAVALEDRILVPGGGLVEDVAAPTTQCDVFVPDRLVASPESIPPTGGVQSHTLYAGAAHAGDTYLLLGSSVGTSPGFLVDGMTLPLSSEFNPWFNYSVLSANQPPFVGTLGVLGAGGMATARIELTGPSVAALTGMTLHHAFLVFDFDQFGLIVLTSNAEPLTIE